MINKQIVTILAILILIPSTLWASSKWNHPDKGYFKTQKDIDKTVSGYSRSSATIAFGGKLYNFINYMSIGATTLNPPSKIIVRELTNIGKSGSIKWNYDKYDNIHTLKGLSYYHYQPAPVVFQDKLILFVGDRDDSVSYSTYIPATKKWSSLKKTFDNVTPAYMSAVVIGKKLCLITLGDDGRALLSSTDDLVKWVTTSTDIHVRDKYIKGLLAYLEISAVTQTYIKQTYIKENALEEKLLIGYINTSQHARCAEYDLDLESGKFTKIINKSIASDQKYSSVTLVQGSVDGDPSTGNMVQAFLKKARLDNGYQRVRILRYQTIIDEYGESGDWTKQENNLVKQNYLWASKRLNLTAVNFPVTDGTTISQYMCLIYRGYDDWDHPLNCAWVETDKLKQKGTAKQTLSKPKYIQYIGYIEGPPPFYKNDEAEYSLLTPKYEWISTVEFSYEAEHSKDKHSNFTVELKVTGGFKGFKASLSEEYAHKKNVVKTTTITHKIEVHPTDKPTGYYITLQPVINRADYKVYDVRGTYLYTTYYFWMSQPYLFNVAVTGLADSKLNPQFPGTYRNRGKNFDSFHSLIPDDVIPDVSWVRGSGASVTIAVTEETETTNTSTTTIELKEDIWSVDFDISGSIEVEISTTTKTGNEVICTTDLNEAVEDTDLTALNYAVHWLKPTKGNDSWWLYPGQDPKQKTWCLTYEVYSYTTNDGTKHGSIRISERDFNQ